MSKAWKDQLGQILERLTLLEEKYAGMGQDMLSYLEGLYYSNGLTYWEYIHLDSLLGLQQPRTPFRDENIFIVYHQITELYFKLIKLELESLTADPPEGEPAEYLQVENWQKRIGRCNNYLKHLCNSFDIMVVGMDREELRKFRMALLPASGFQSVQYREIEIMSTSLSQLTKGEDLPSADSPLEELYPHLYWKQGGIDLETKKKTITLKAFEEKYDEQLHYLLRKFKSRNVYQRYLGLPEDLKTEKSIRETLRDYDRYVNVYWKLAHLAAASRHLVHGEKAVDATGGTNWRQFLPPRFQRITFFPELWTKQELDDWGRDAVVSHFRGAVTQNWGS